ncbi:MAG: protein kinase [Myxococcota bacterium]
MITLKRRIARDERTETWFAKDGDRALIVEKLRHERSPIDAAELVERVQKLGREPHPGLERALAIAHRPLTFVFRAPEGTTLEDLALMAGGTVPVEIALSIGASIASGLEGLDRELGSQRPRLAVPIDQVRINAERGAELRDPAFLAAIFAISGGPRGEERHYAAPELLEGRPSPTSEVYAIAALVHRLITDAPQSADLGGLDQELRGLLGPALATNPAQRPSLAAWARALGRAPGVEAAAALRSWLTEVSQSRIASVPSPEDTDEEPSAGAEDPTALRQPERAAPLPRKKTIAIEDEEAASSLEAWEAEKPASPKLPPAPPSVSGEESASHSGESDPLVGLVLHGYRLDERLGMGAYAQVYRGLHLYLNKEVAIKVLRGHLGGSGTARRRMVREAAALAALEHENIVRILDFGFAPNGLPFLVTELVRGQPLAAALAGKRTSPREIARIGAAIARGLAAAHARGIIHRDLKPANVMLVDRPEGPEVKVLDFGMARMADGPTRLTKAGSLIGTPLYMAPEQIRGASEVGPAADLYSLGALLFAAVKGQAPFVGSTGDVLEAHLHKAPPPLPPLGGLELWIARLLEKAPEARPKTAAEVAEALEALGGKPKPAARPLGSRAETIATLILSLLALAAAIWSR